jgi:hypothetical protein
MAHIKGIETSPEPKGKESLKKINFIDSNLCTV